jgi:hypothetical protein
VNLEEDGEDKESKRIEQILNSAEQQLGEYFDNVQIFVISRKNGSTYFGRRGMGNLYARRGQVQEWLLEEEEIVRCRARKYAEEEGE